MANRAAEKGARGEREVIELWRAAGFLQAQRSRAGAEEDRGDIASLPELTCEVKNIDDIARAVGDGMRELAVEKVNNATPWGVLMFKRRRKGWVAMMPAEEFIALWAKIHGVTPHEE